MVTWKIKKVKSLDDDKSSAEDSDVPKILKKIAIVRTYIHVVWQAEPGKNILKEWSTVEIGNQWFRKVSNSCE